MTERNLIKEGFVINTLAPDGSVSGTQTVSIPQINGLVDEDFSSTALTVSGTFFTSLDADLGARWKLDKIELYTDDSSSANFEMLISDDGVDFTTITMTGSAGLWIGDIPITAASGSPRFIRYEHLPGSDTAVQEWRGINDDTLVNFGSTGLQTSVEISDAPIGKPSDQITTLTLRNDFTKTAQGFIYIDNTGTKADDNIEIGLSAGGPFFGQQLLTSKQPTNTPWADNVSIQSGNIDLVSLGGALDNVRVVSGTAYRTDFVPGLNGWTTTGFTSTTTINGALRGNISTSLSPSFVFDQSDASNPASSPDSAESVSSDFKPFRAQDYDRVEVVLNAPALLMDDFTESARLFWKAAPSTVFDSAHSLLSTTPNSNFNGTSQTFVFDVVSSSSWEGVIAGFKVQPYTLSSGTGFSLDLESLEVSNTSLSDRIALDFEPVISGTFIGKLTGTEEGTVIGHNVIINFENPVKEPCVITSVSAFMGGPGIVDGGGFILVSLSGVNYDDTATSINNATDPFVIKEFVASDEAVNAADEARFYRQPVFWNASPGDYIGYGIRTFLGSSRVEPTFTFDTTLTTTTGGGLASAVNTEFLNIRDSRTKAQVQSSLNGITIWETTGKRYNIQFEAVSAGPYVQNGAYTTPIFDGGGQPSLLSSEFTSSISSGTSIDVDSNAAFNTIEARASDTPPDTAQSLGIRQNSYFLGAHPSDLPSAFDPDYTSNYVIGIFNEEVSTRENPGAAVGSKEIESIGASAFHNQNTDELWILNTLISGTDVANMRPIWDVYAFDIGEYKKTLSVSGSITYSHNNNGTLNNLEPNTFEGISFIPNYTDSELYIVSREDEFAIGAGTYNGIILDLNDHGFKDVFWRNDQILTDIVDTGTAGSVITADRHLKNMRDMAFRKDAQGAYFFALTDRTNESELGLVIDIYRFGNDVTNPGDLNRVRFINSIDLTLIFPEISSSNPAEVIEYCPINNLFYLFTAVASDSIFTLNISRIGTPPTESFVGTRGPISEASINQLLVSNRIVPGTVGARFLDGFARGAGRGVNNWLGAGDEQELRTFGSLFYSESRDTFGLLVYYLSDRTPELQVEGDFQNNYFLWHQHTHTTVVELGANTSGKTVTTPGINFPANPTDALWGTLSGTLNYSELQSNSVLFPTGRFGQLRYTLNSDSNKQNTPYLLSSRLNQGISISNIPAAGTRDIFLRTNIPETETIGDQTGSLKVFWQLEEC